jgi:hypothetical protein
LIEAKDIQEAVFSVPRGQSARIAFQRDIEAYSKQDEEDTEE